MHFSKHIGLLLVLTAMMTVLWTCKDEPVKPPTKPPIKPPLFQTSIGMLVQYEDFTEVLLKVFVNDTNARKTFELKRNGELILRAAVFGADTLITDSLLQTDARYTYQASILNEGKSVDSCSVVAQTRRPGSQSWRFEVDTLGEDQSTLSSIIAFSKNDAWACGSLLKYSNGIPPIDTSYAVAHWNGVRWEQQIIREPVFNIPEEGYLICGSSPTDLWFIGGRTYRYSAGRWMVLPLSLGTLDGAIEQVHVINSNSMYFVGLNGKIGYWDGSRFNNPPSPTTCTLNDIYGESDLMYAAGESRNGARSVILRIENNFISVVDSLKSPWTEFTNVSVWFKQKDSVFAYAGSDDRIIHRNNVIHPTIPREKIPFSTRVRGTGLDNIWWVGHGPYLLHYNGSTWKEFREIQLVGSGVLVSLDVKEDYLFACGYVRLKNGSLRGIVVRGYRE